MKQQLEDISPTQWVEASNGSFYHIAIDLATELEAAQSELVMERTTRVQNYHDAKAIELELRKRLEAAEKACKIESDRATYYRTKWQDAVLASPKELAGTKLSDGIEHYINNLKIWSTSTAYIGPTPGDQYPRVLAPRSTTSMPSGSIWCGGVSEGKHGCMYQQCQRISLQVNSVSAILWIWTS